MKSWFILSFLVLAYAAQAQPTNAPPAQPKQSFQAQIARPPVPAPAVVAPIPLKPNEMISGKLIYSGISVEAVKTGHPLQLFNPFAPPKYGGPAENVIQDPITGRFSGLKLFAIRF